MKKTALLLLLLFTLFFSFGCGREGDLEYVKNITPDQIFTQKEDKYYVYFHRINCPDCETSDPKIIEYGYIINEYESCATKRKLYAVVLYTKDEKPGRSTYIYREYEGEGGQGTDGKYFVNGVTKWEDLYIASTASLIAINTNLEGKKVASYIAQGSASVNEKISTQLDFCYE